MIDTDQPRRPGPLLIIVSEEISAWIDKGEVVANYYNPGSLFDQVHILLTNEDVPDANAIATMVGDARFEVHNLPTPRGLLTRTLGLRTRLLRRWSAGAVELARTTGASLVRCYGASLNAHAAIEIQREIGIPVVISLHINPDEDIHGRARGITERIRARISRSLERRTLRSADMVLPVYEAIVPYLERLGVERYRVAYNMLPRNALRRKTKYEIGDPPQIVCVGRQIPEKRPANLIRALASTDEAELTLIGDGPEHESLKAIAAEIGVSHRVKFVRSMPNRELCSRLADFDLFAAHSEYWELSKAVLEAMLTGLPVILNRRRGEPVPELTPDICRLVEDTAEGYHTAINDLINDAVHRESLGRRAVERASREWAPSVTESRFRTVYLQLLEGNR